MSVETALIKKSLFYNYIFHISIPRYCRINTIVSYRSKLNIWLYLVFEQLKAVPSNINRNASGERR